MEHTHRRSILANIEGLIAVEKIEVLLALLIEKNVFKAFMITDLKAAITSPRAFKLQLFMDVQKRGPKAFQSLLDCLKEIGEDHLADSLSQYSDEFEDECGNNRICDEVDSIAVPGAPRFENSQLPVSEIHDGSCNGTAFNDIQDENAPNHHKKATKTVSSFANQSIARSNSVLTTTSAYNGTDPEKCYQMLSKPRGRALVINIIKFLQLKRERHGATFDTANLKKLFEDLNFEVDYIVDTEKKVEKEDLKSGIDAFIQKCSEKDIDCCMVVVMSHGEGFYKIETSDGLHSDFYKIINKKFCNANFKKFCHKPKVFVMQACRGQEENLVLDSSQSQTDTQSPEHEIDSKRLKTDGPDEKIKKPLKGLQDTIIINSTIPGFKSMRDENRGTIFIESFCDIVRKHAFELNLDEMINLINEDMSKKSDFDERGREILQNVHIEKFSPFLQLYFNPGL